MNFSIKGIDKSEYQETIEVWEASVRATHDFISEEDIQTYKPLILNQYFDVVELRSIRDENNKILGFSGVAEQNIEMLFIDPAYRGKGLGKILLNHCIEVLDCYKVDVNEQNTQAVGFYLKMNFKTVRRSEVDGEGKLYPLLHMEVKG
ncbi:GNAT family N-acetyltransferase [Flammeovirga yaeyamensis]|uniref:GNAT family N-acetyltransferase n=1 Tax=Flammeovirga yaeyamensis TaxID=367791 RepID=A0AAX1NCK3_9BACT|nr:GNAT family N-acetyltransferase [Flammeovirga yaeyamensis]MBB3696862.1 putative acetyltransferase [Flammeovirga yaeyamensis]NMF33528.1 GNAT family N-acetyltransferase [Flammeovirga yaeyamensis]QWG05202.1 GNAT family N-acetyltransferase [Flammeovirga yaeyamensis]